MLKKTDRLTKAQFDAYFRSGKRVHTPYLQLIYTPHTEFHGAVVVGKKVHKHAVDRNRLRRQLYNRLYQLRKSDGLSGVFIFIAKPPIITLPQKELSNVVSELIGQAQKKR